MYNILNIFYGDFINPELFVVPEVTKENYPDIKMCEAIFTYDLPQIILLDTNILIPWIENNNAIYIDKCPIDRISFTSLPILFT